MLLLARFYTAQLSMTAHMDTHTYTRQKTGGQLSLGMTVSTKEHWLLVKKTNTLKVVQPQTHFSTSSSAVCVSVSGSLSAFQFVFQTQSVKKKYSMYKVWRQDENRWSRWRRMNKTDNMNKPDGTRWGGNLHQGKMFVQPAELQPLERFMFPPICLLGLIPWENSMQGQQCLASCQLGAWLEHYGWTKSHIHITMYSSWEHRDQIISKPVGDLLRLLAIKLG